MVLVKVLATRSMPVVHAYHLHMCVFKYRSYIYSTYYGYLTYTSTPVSVLEPTRITHDLYMYCTGSSTTIFNSVESDLCPPPNYKVEVSHFYSN